MKTMPGQITDGTRHDGVTAEHTPSVRVALIGLSLSMLLASLGTKASELT